MTAPGNSPLILTLLAAFIACTGYAGGRLHQWYRMGRDRDDAFRDGYDTATRSVFTLAARAISPRRADRSDRSEIRAGAVSLPASAVIATDTASPAARTRATAQPARTPATKEPARTPAARTPASVSPARQAANAGPARRSSVPAPAVLPATTPATAPAAMPSAMPATMSAAMPATAPTARSAAAKPSPQPTTSESSGRHTVPDELVQAATYRLNADRVARAKVPGAVQPAEPAGAERTPLLAVPKPRAS
jgi:hypothetical protein